jgi:hypothetical protein
MSPPSRGRQHGVHATASPVKVGEASQPVRQAVIRVLLATTSVAFTAGGTTWLRAEIRVGGVMTTSGEIRIVSAAANASASNGSLSRTRGSRSGHGDADQMPG